MTRTIRVSLTQKTTKKKGVCIFKGQSKGQAAARKSARILVPEKKGKREKCSIFRLGRVLPAVLT